MVEESGSCCQAYYRLVIRGFPQPLVFIQDGWRALAYAVARGYADTARLLLENGATMNFEDDVRKN